VPLIRFMWRWTVPCPPRQQPASPSNSQGAEGLTIRGLYVVDERLIMNPYAKSDRELGTAQGLASRPELIARFKERGDAVLRWLEVSCREAGVPVSTDLLLGPIPERVLQSAANACLLALGRRGLGHATDGRHLGSNLRAIARHVSRPILIGGDEEISVHRLLLVYDPSRRNQEALAWASVFERILASPAIVLAPQKDASALRSGFSEAEMQADLEASGLTGYRLAHGQDSLGPDIVAAAAQSNVDLIIIGERRHSVLSRSLLDPVLDHVLRSSSLPVLVA